MWIDDQGVFQTVALPDPTELMSDFFRRGLDRLLAQARKEVADAIEIEELRFHAEGATLIAASDEERFAGDTPPKGLMAEPIRTVEDLTECIRDMDDRWRLDALVALTDYVDGAKETDNV